MSIARFSIEKPVTTWVLILTMLLGGVWGFFNLGRLEDPAFTIKSAIVVTEYPGASAMQVAREISEPLESEIQKMGEVDLITSTNRPGISRIQVDMKDNFDGEALPEIWTKLRNRVGDAHLPTGADAPHVNDSFGDVYGIYYAVTAPGFSDAEIYQLSAFLRRELLTVAGVADVALSGVPQEVIYIEPDLTLSANQGASPEALLGAVSNANSVLDVGVIEGPAGRRLVSAPRGESSVADIANMTIGIDGKLLHLDDFTQVRRSRENAPDILIRHNGQDAFTLGVSGLKSENIVDVGMRVDARLDALAPQIPLGVTLHPIYQQHVVVDAASSGFLVSLTMSLGIVVLVLALFMGPSAALVVGVTLLLTVTGTLFFMQIFSIEMERISLGALIIAMGMLVDNALVVAEGMQVAMAHGRDSRAAAEETARKTQIPLLGATVIGIMAFAGIGLSDDATGEFLFSLFAVIAISLLLSWLLAITATPLLGHYVFRRGAADAQDAYDGPVFRAYKAVLKASLRLRWLVVLALAGLTALCFIGFGQVKQQFFPDSNTPLFFVHYQLPQGASIQQTSQDIAQIEDWMRAKPDVVSTTAYVGQGAARFMLTYQARDPNPSYGHLIVRTQSLEPIAGLIAELESFAAQALPQGKLTAKRLAFGPGGADPIELRISGPDPATLRELAHQAQQILRAASDDIVEPEHDWREMELVLRPNYATDRAQEAGIRREDVAATLLFATEGAQAGVYREEERQIPILIRVAPDEDIALEDMVVLSGVSSDFMPLEQVLDGLRLEPQNTRVQRRNRVYTITVSADIAKDRTAAQVQAEIQEAVEAMPLPDGYRMAWGGEYENSRDAQAALGAQLPASLLIMVAISILLFSALRQPLVIWLLAPMAVNGVTVALLGTGAPFTFTALLGLLSLSGMLIKNGIVLVEEIDLVRAERPDAPLRESIILASASRLRPVVLAAATTILGMVPLIWDAFFASMAITIMGGLAFASILTLVAAPVFYFIFFARDQKRKPQADAPAAA